MVDYVEHSGEVPQDTNSTDTSNHKQSQVVLIQLIVGAVTFVTVFLLRVSVYLCLRCRAGRRARHDQPEEQPEEQTEPEAPRTNQEADTCSSIKEFHVLSEIPGDLVVYPASTALGFYLIHSRTHGLSASGSSPFLDFNSTFGYFFAAVLGHLVYRICSLAVMPMQRRYKMDIVHYLAATAVYVVILVKREDAILGAVGMLPWAPLAFLSLRRATKMADCLAFPHWVASLTWAMTSPLFMLVVPAAYLIDSMVHNSVEDMSIVSIGTFCFALAYFGLAFLAHVIRAMMKVFCFVSPEQLHEGSSLLFTRGSSNTGHNNVEEATASQPNTWIRGSFNNYFLDASKNGEVPFAKEESRPSEPEREDC